jgi:hypothetical protein
MSAPRELIMEDFGRFEAPGYEVFRDLGEGFEAIVLENALLPTDLLKGLIQGLLVNKETMVFVDGDLILPVQRVVLAMQRLSVKGEDMYATNLVLKRLQ